MTGFHRETTIIFAAVGHEFFIWDGSVWRFNLMIHDKSGQGLTEYLILILLVAVVSIAAAKSLGNTVKDKLQQAREHINRDVSIYQ
jgi:Flp pilus assembly pilin Flp